MLKKNSVYVGLILFVSFLSACGSAAPPPATEVITSPSATESTTSLPANGEAASSTITEIWPLAGRSVCAWFNGDEPEYSMGLNTDPTTIRVGKTPKGNDVFSFLYLPMRGTFLFNEIESVKLYLKIVEGETPSTLRMGLLNDFWSNGVTDLAGAKKLTEPVNTAAITVNQAEDGWVCVDITGYATDWLSGAALNNGLVMLGETDGELTQFASDWYEGVENPPYLEVTGTVGERDLSYGKFAYLRHPENKSDDALIAEEETTNCLSYALRDTNIIGADELELDYSAMTDIYKKSGEDGVAAYCAKKIIDYVQRNKDALKISNFRQIENFNSEIDAEKEYRIAFRVGCKLFEGENILDDTDGFNYHLWAQVNTGQWAQKVMFSPSEIVPCTPPGTSPEKYPWDSTLDWGEVKSYGFLTSKAVYFAVTKDADGFTQHKG